MYNYYSSFINIPFDFEANMFQLLQYCSLWSLRFPSSVQFFSKNAWRTKELPREFVTYIFPTQKKQCCWIFSCFSFFLSYNTFYPEVRTRLQLYYFLGGQLRLSIRAKNSIHKRKQSNWALKLTRKNGLNPKNDKKEIHRHGKEGRHSIHLFANFNSEGISNEKAPQTVEYNFLQWYQR